MIRKWRIPSVLAAALLAGLVLLSGCDSAAGAPPVPTLPAAPGAATPATGASAGPATAAAASTPGAGSAAGANGCTVLNLNTETEAQLTATIPNFPTRMIREFLEYRPYTSILEFRQQIGKYVGSDQVGAWEKYVYVPIDPNTSDTATLQQIPGVDSTVAATLISGRPYATPAAFQQALAAHLTAPQRAAARCYLGAQ